MILAIIWCAITWGIAADAPATPTMEPAPQAATTGTTSAPAAATSPAPAVAPVETPAPAAAATPADLPPTSSSEAVVNPSALAPPSQNVTINLINRLVQKGILTKEDAADLIKQAEADAELAHAQVIATQNAASQAQAAQAAVAQAATESLPPASEDSTRVTYIPEVVKQQMRDQIKQEVMDQARDENWAAPRTLPEWTTRIRISGDLRTRYEGDFFPAGNETGEEGAGTNLYNNFNTNFNLINTNNPVSYQNPLFSPNSTNILPKYNVDQNRDRFRLRARLAVDADLGDNFTAGIRVASGNDDNPVTENQTLGGANSAQGGNFSKYAIWIDRAFIRYQLGDTPNKQLTLTAGRFDNPFFSTSMIWANDLGFDGVVAAGKYQVTDSLTPFITAGAFPVFNTDFNFGTNSNPNGSAYSSYDKYLYAMQIGTDWKLSKDLNLKFGTALYDYQNIQGQVSSPINDYQNISGYYGSTDDSRPAFAQTGNTYIYLRDLRYTASPGDSSGNGNFFEYYGLATPFRELALTTKLDYSHFEPFHLSLIAEYVNNIAFDANSIRNNGPSNPTLHGPVNNLNASGGFQGGNSGWFVNLQAGCAALTKFGDWNAGLGYRYVESDCVVDGFSDADFGAPNTGTNLKGYTLYGNYALSPRVWFGLRWMAANAIAGPTYKSDIIQVDINAKF